jgi:hypothetical protein
MGQPWRIAGHGSALRRKLVERNAFVDTPIGREAELSQALPQRAIIACLSFENPADGLGIAAILKEPARLVAQLKLLGGKFEIHPSSARRLFPRLKVLES